MLNDLSYGVVPLKRVENDWQVLLIQHHAGHWSFPKGHPEIDENPLQAASRELFEETGLHIEKLLFPEPEKEKYVFKHQGKLVHKTVFYFVAEVKGKVKLQKEELQAYQWIPLKDAGEKVSFPQAAQLCEKVLGKLQH